MVSRVGSSLALAGLALGCSEGVGPKARQEIHVKIQVSSGENAVANEIKALEELGAREGDRVKMIPTSVAGRPTTVTMVALLDRARSSAPSEAIAKPQIVTPEGVGILRDVEGPAQIVTPYTLVSSPVNQGGTSLAFSHMDAMPSKPVSYGRTPAPRHASCNFPRW
jgi:hypothetical protein